MKKEFMVLLNFLSVLFIYKCNDNKIDENEKAV